MTFTAVVVGLAAVFLTAGQIGASARALSPRQLDGPEWACMRNSGSPTWEITELKVQPGKGLSFHVVNSVTDYNTDCSVSVHPVKEADCGDVTVSYAEETSTLSISQRWECPQPNWPTNAYFIADGAREIPLQCEGYVSDCSLPDFVWTPDQIRGVA